MKEVAKGDAEELWMQLDGKTGDLLRRSERYCELTIPKLMRCNGRNNEEAATDYQSIGAQGVNHLANKMMMVMFRPSHPFFRLQVGVKAKRGIDPKALAGIMQQLGEVERDAVKVLDSTEQRAKLYQVMRHLIVIGNCLLIRDKRTLRVLSLKYYRVKRTISGKLHTLVVREELNFNELDQKAQDEAIAAKVKKDGQDNVCFYTVVKLTPSGKYSIDQYVNEHKLNEQDFSGSYSSDDLPFHALTWNLADEDDYGTGLVEEYHGALEAVSVLSEGVVDGAVIGCEYRWGMDPTAQLKPEDFNKSKNGDAIPARKDDMTPLYVNNGQAVREASAVIARYEQQLARAFLMMSAVTRDAERVTAEEIRALINELESAHGGTYSSLSPQLQKPIAVWCLEEIDMGLEGADIEVQILTGLDALSRSGDLEALRLAFGDLAFISQLPEALQARIDFVPLAAFVGNGRGIDITPFLKSEDQYQQEQEQLRASQVAQETATAAGQAAATRIAQ